MQFLEELESLGVNTKEGLDRVLGDESLYEMMLGLFVTSVEGSPIGMEEFDGADRTSLMEKLHALKGTAGNLSLTPLFTHYTTALDMLRNNDPAGARKEYEALLPAQAEIISCIQRHQ